MPSPAWLPSRTALLIAAIAFAAGLLLFLALWLDQRSSNEFYKTGALPVGAEGQAFEPLPAPLPATKAGHVGGSEQDDDEAVAGTPLLRVHVDARGNPGDIDVVAGSGSRSLDRAAVEAVGRWRFAPATRDGEPVAGTVQVPIDFTLQR